jgi:hypothetical protein
MMNNTDLVPADGRRDLRRRGEDGLTPPQRQYLQELAETGDEAQAAENTSIELRRVTRWLREDEAYRRVYKEQTAVAVEATKTRLALITEKIPELLVDLMQEMKPISVTVYCTQCKKDFTTQVTVRDANVRAKVIESLMKSTGIQKDIRKMEVEGEVVHLTFYQKVALERARRGMKVGVQTRRELEGLGYLDPLKYYGDEDVIEGDAQEVPE